jgi:(2R)-sulfolactate sulfo-lyase subunit beta
VVIGIEPGWTKKIADGIRETGKPVAEFSIEQKGDLRRSAPPPGPPRNSSTCLGNQREECSISELWVSTKCGESDTTTGLGSCPTVGNMYDKLLPEGITGFFGETSEITGAEHICQKARDQRGSGRALVQDVEGVSGRRHLRPPDR